MQFGIGVFKLNKMASNFGRLQQKILYIVVNTQEAGLLFELLKDDYRINLTKRQFAVLTEQKGIRPVSVCYNI